jgi:cytochrome c oxidase subunit IV
MSDHTTGDIHNQVVEDHHHDSSTKEIWRTFWILLIITVFEVGIAFTSISKEILKITFIVLTIVKAYFIVAYFMHLKHERKGLQWVILLPFVLIVYFIYMMLNEGTALNGTRSSKPEAPKTEQHHH